MIINASGPYVFTISGINAATTIVAAVSGFKIRTVGWILAGTAAGTIKWISQGASPSDLTGAMDISQAAAIGMSGSREVPCFPDTTIGYGLRLTPVTATVNGAVIVYYVP